MKEYLTISEFASLRNVNINSLRYYEKLGILIPAYIDPYTKYRYYTPEQIVILDVIILAIRLELPLKKLKEYIDKDGNIDHKSLFDLYRHMLSKKIAEVQTGLNAIEFTLNNMEQNETYSRSEGVYLREIGDRYFIVKRYEGDNDIAAKEKFSMELFLHAQKKKMSPLFPAGIIIDYKKHPTVSVFFQILNPPASDKNVIKIPKQTFACAQVDLTVNSDIFQLIENYFPTKEKKTVIVANMDMNKLCFKSKHTEFQTFVK